jgi:hypothetical protein
MPRARRVATAVLAGVSALLVAVPGVAARAAVAAPLAAAVTQDAVIPADSILRTVDDQVIVAGTTGLLHAYNFASSPVLWTDYATGTTIPVPGLAGPGLAGLRPAGRDNVAVIGPAAANPAGDVGELDLATMTWQHWPIPAKTTVLGVAGSSAFAVNEATSPSSFEVLTFASDGTATQAPVTFPAGGRLAAARPLTVDATAMVIAYTVNGVIQDALLDLATGNLIPIPGTAGNTSGQVVLSPGNVTVYDPRTQTVQEYSRAGLLAGTSVTPATVTLPGVSGTDLIALAGDHVIAVPAIAESSVSYTTQPALDVPLSGAAAGQAAAKAQTGGGAIAETSDGAALIVGGTGPADWSVRRLTVDGGDNLVSTPVLPLTGPMTNAGLTISQGMVRHIEQAPPMGGQPRYLMFNHLLPPFDAVSSPLTDLDGGPLTSPLPCAPGGSCVRTVDGNDYGTSFLAADTATSVNLREILSARSSSMTTTLASASGTIVDASPGWAIVNGANPARQYLVKVGFSQVTTRPVTGAGLWFDTLWRSAGGGQLQATDLDTSATATPVATGANCAATEIQATQRWVYWSCGPNGPAGVYDQVNRVSIAVPAGPVLLGDGYLVQHDSSSGDLVMYDVHADSVAAPVTLATVPAGPASDDRNITWAVDKYSGDIAYVAADDSVHVINAGVPATPTAVTEPSASVLKQANGIYFDSNGAWRQGVALSRPVTSWTLTISNAGTTKVVHTGSGGASRLGIGLTWDGRLANGAKAYSGPYTWSLSVTTPGSGAATTVTRGPVVVNCGQIPYRSYDCDGRPGFLVDLGGTLGPAHWVNGARTSSGLTDNGYTDNWALCPYSGCVSTIVPFGDFNGDGLADILVKDRSGQLRAYLGIGQSYFNTQVVKSINLGAGWNAYNALAYPGDLNRDGKPDLVARDSAGRLWLFASAGHGKFRGRVQISGSWGGYARLVGAGDLTGDGHGDLLAIDKSGEMWRLAGNGRGGFAGRQPVGGGWSGYNAVISIGDLSIDGCNDLLARDRQGTLYRFNGNCHGGFAARVTIGGGWAKWQGMF